MSDYNEMYLALFRAQTRAIAILEDAQLQIEKIFVASMPKFLHVGNTVLAEDQSSNAFGDKTGMHNGTMSRPLITSTSPTNGAADVALETDSFAITFDVAMNTDVVGTVNLLQLGGKAVPILTNPIWLDNNKTIRYSINGLEPETSYSFRIRGFQDTDGIVMDEASGVINFCTQSEFSRKSSKL